MYRIEVMCEKGMSLRSCGGERPGWWTTEDLAEPIPDGFRQALTDHGWAEHDGKFYCPRHDPAKQGTHLVIGLDYVELAPGVRVRWPGAEREGDGLPIEVQMQHRECHGYVGAQCGGGNGVYEPGTEWAAWHKPNEKGR